jgi:hypothetical protein
MAMLRRAGEKAGVAKWPREFKIPIMSAVSPMKKRYGNIMRVRSMVRAWVEFAITSMYLFGI